MVSQPTISKALSRMVDQNYISRKCDPRDKRVVIYSINPEYRDFVIKDVLQVILDEAANDNPKQVSILTSG